MEASRRLTESPRLLMETCRQLTEKFAAARGMFERRRDRDFSKHRIRNTLFARQYGWMYRTAQPPGRD